MMMRVVTLRRERYGCSKRQLRDGAAIVLVIEEAPDLKVLDFCERRSFVEQNLVQN